MIGRIEFLDSQHRIRYHDRFGEAWTVYDQTLLRPFVWRTTAPPEPHATQRVFMNARGDQRLYRFVAYESHDLVADLLHHQLAWAHAARSGS